MSYTEQSPSPFLSVSFSLQQNGAAGEGEGRVQKMRSGWKRKKTAENQEWLLLSSHPVLATIWHNVNHSNLLHGNKQHTHLL